MEKSETLEDQKIDYKIDPSQPLEMIKTQYHRRPTSSQSSSNQSSSKQYHYQQCLYRTASIAADKNGCQNEHYIGTSYNPDGNHASQNQPTRKVDRSAL